MPSKKQTTVPINWLNTAVLTTTPLIVILSLPFYWQSVGFNAFDWICFAAFMILTGLGITAGYHRLWSHKAYEASTPVQYFLAYWGACAGQNSILSWASDHRRHHQFTDHDNKDPYSISKGFWYAHVGWIIRDSKKEDFSNVKDLEKIPAVRWQHRWYIPIAFGSNIIPPLLLGLVNHHYFQGSIFGVIILAGFLRFVLNHHFTFFINSAAHVIGKQPYSTGNSSRDCTLLALVTYGEGYHNFHHTFQNDYRNGVRWWHFDPTKWLISTLSWMRLTKNLKRIPNERIIRKKMTARMDAAVKKANRRKQFIENDFDIIRKKFETYSESLKEWEDICRHMRQAKAEQGREFYRELKQKAGSAWDNALLHKKELTHLIDSICLENCIATN